MITPTAPLMRLRRLSWRPDQWQADLKSRLTRLGFKFDFTVVTIRDDPVTNQKSQPGAGTNSLCREERFKYPRLDFRRDTSPVVHDFHHQLIIFDGGANADLAAAIHRIDGIIDEIRPNLVEFAAVSQDANDQRPG